MKSILKPLLLAITFFALLFSFSAFQSSSSRFILESTLEKDRIITLDKLPTTIEEFLEMRNKISKTPEGGATTMIVALMLYSQNPKLGLPCLTIAIDKKWLSKSTGKESYKGYMPTKTYLSRIKDQMKRYPYVPFSYIKGSKVDNGYKIPNGKLVFDFSTNAYSGKEESGLIKLFIPSSGADSARPIKVHKNDKGIWKAYEWSTIVMGIRAPKVDDDDDL